jgi:enoyl-CoA hydratase/carnithine racemase
VYAQDDAIAIITINRPERGNSLNRAVREGLRGAWERFAADPSARVAILTGAGDRTFCAGADLNEMAENANDSPGADWVPVLGDNLIIDKPVIAAVNGNAFGGGFLQAQMCDLAIASSNARFGITEARWGRGSPWALPLFRMIPTRTIMELLLTAQPIDANRAREVGLVNRIVEPADLMPSARVMAQSIVANAPLSLIAAKRMARAAATIADTAEAQARTRQIYELVYASRDAQIGPRAFRDGCMPIWTGT